MRKSRVLVCGSRTWGVTDPDDVDPWRPTKPQFDHTSLEALMTISLLDGLYTDHSIGYAVAHLDPFVIIEGGAPGADSMAWWWATQAPTHHYESDRFQHLHFPAKWFEENGEFRRWAGPERNKKMLEEGRPDLVIACTHDLSQSRGTSHMVKISREAGIPVYILGEVK